MPKADGSSPSPPRDGGGVGEADVPVRAPTVAPTERAPETAPVEEGEQPAAPCAPADPSLARPKPPPRMDDFTIRALQDDDDDSRRTKSYLRKHVRAEHVVRNNP